MGISTTDGNYGPSLGMPDQDGYGADADGVTGVWHQRVINLQSLVGRTIDYTFFQTPISGSTGAWSVDYRDFVYLGADGSVTKIYSGEDPTGWVQPTTSGMTVSSTSQAGAPYPGGAEPVRYYLDDHLGTAQVEVGRGSWPLWKGQFTPFGQELDNGQTAMHYKFTGKERDTESGLDYFGARYYASSLGRWMSPDWADKPEAVPYSSLDNPQSLNLYGYVGNNPLSKTDADGHDGETAGVLRVAATAEAVAPEASAVILPLAAVAVVGAAIYENWGSIKEFGHGFAEQLRNSNVSNASCLACAAAQPLQSNVAKATPAAAADGKTAPGPVKAADAPGQTAGGQATNEHGQKLAPSGKPQINNVSKNTREGANNAANKGSGTIEHPNPKVGDPHFHTARGDGTKVQDSTHYNYPK